MTVLLAGDSWGIGVFENHPVTGYGPTGEGIHTILRSMNIPVVNISKAGGANWLQLDRMNGEWNNFLRCKYGVDPADRVDVDFKKIGEVVFLQTDVFREHYYHIKEHPDATETIRKWLDDDFVESLLHYDSISQFIEQYFSSLYLELNNIGITHNKKILCIGGWSKLHPSISNYSNLVPVIMSSAQLLIPTLESDVYASDPDWFVQFSDNAKIMKKFGNEVKKMTIDAHTKFDAVINNWHEVHPKIDGYEKIVAQLIPYLTK